MNVQRRFGRSPDDPRVIRARQQYAEEAIRARVRAVTAGLPVLSRDAAAELVLEAWDLGEAG